MEHQDDLARQFEQSRSHLRAVAYRMLGSLSEAEDAVQEAWLRLSRSDAGEIANLGGWLTTVVSRVCLDLLRSRKARREDPLDTYVPDPVVTWMDPEEEAVHTDSVGLAMLVVLETLKPAERLAFVLHDLFGVSFDDIAPIVDKTPAATRQLAGRARRRVQDAPTGDSDLDRRREVVEAFLAASRSGNFEGLLAVLDPDVVLRADAGAGPARGVATSRLVRGAKTVVEQALLFGRLSPHAQLAMVNGSPGLVTVAGDRVIGVMSAEVRDGRIVEFNILADPSRLESITVRA